MIDGQKYRALAYLWATIKLIIGVPSPSHLAPVFPDPSTSL